MKFLLDMGLAQSTARFLRQRGQNLPSVITFRLSDMCPPSVNRQLSEVLLRFAEYLETGGLVSVTDRGIRVRRLPVSHSKR